MNGSKDNPGGGGGGRGATNGLCGGKTKQVARGCNDRGIKSSEPDPSRGAHDKPTVWRHGKYVIVRPPKGPGLASRRARTSSHSRVYGGDQGTSLARPLDMSKTLRDMSKDIIEDDNDDFNEDFEDGDNSDDGENNGGDAGDEDGRDLIDLQGKRIMAHNEGGGGRGRGGGPSSRRETTAHSSTRGGRGRDGGRGSNQVNGHGSTDYREQPTTEAYQLLHEPSDDEDEPIAIGRGAVVPPPIPTPENRIWIWVENDEFNIQNRVSRTIGSILKLMWSGGWIGWKDVPIFHRDRMFERFQKYYQWEDEENHSIHSCWERCIKGKFPNLLGKARKFAKTRALKKGIEVGKYWSVIIPFKPQWISQDS
ncbi:uncharacterized protein LOC143548037 [Bidens hawaiensis]|uniref:uncharacterized protein LOC143548037 n=1 Tax=Bidens hawaiensis TaxID=980011 RepID=UPI004048F91A